MKMYASILTCFIVIIAAYESEETKCNHPECKSCKDGPDNCDRCNKYFQYINKFTMICFPKCPPNTYPEKYILGLYECLNCSSACYEG